MNYMHPVAEAVILGRNCLLNNKLNNHVLPALEQALHNLDLVTATGTRLVLTRCLPEAISLIRANQLMAAGWVLNFVHNLPLMAEAVDGWNIDYFLKIELPNFLDHFDETPGARDITLYVVQQLAEQHSQRPR